MRNHWYKAEFLLWFNWWYRLGVRRPIELFWDLGDWRLGFNLRFGSDGSGRKEHATVIRAQMGPLALAKTVYWGVRRTFHSTRAYGFGDIGGRSLAQRQRAIERYEDDEDEDTE